MMHEREVGCAEDYANCDATRAEGGECYEGLHELVGNAFLGCAGLVGVSVGCGMSRQ